MDKAEYKIATEKIRKLISQGEYAKASYIADTIDWRRVRSVLMLCTISDLYKVNRRFEDAKELLYMAYEKNPNSRTILYSLCDLSIKLEEYMSFLKYYKEFVKIAPKDSGRYVLQYRLYQSQEVGLEERIEVLEHLKKDEYSEKWAYELAYLYHRLGFATKCVEECDELIVWFGKGSYVYKAMELKMLHEPLTPSQQKIYDNRFEYLECANDRTRVLAHIDPGENEMTQDGMIDVTDAPTVEIPQEYLEQELQTQAEDIQVKTLDVANAYNTMNLQRELADSLKELLEVSQTESSVDVAVEEENTDPYINTEEFALELDQKRAVQSLKAEVGMAKTEEVPIEQAADSLETKRAVQETGMAKTKEMPTEEVTESLETKEAVQETDVAETEEIPVEEATGSFEAESFVQDAGTMTRTEELDLQETQIEEAADRSEIGSMTREISSNLEAEMAALLELSAEAKETEADSEAVQKQDKISQEESVLEQTKQTYEAAQGLDMYMDFIRVKDTEKQIMYALEHISLDPAGGNAVVTGRDMSICSHFIGILLADLKKHGLVVSGKTAKISAAMLNKKEPSEVIKVLDGGVLVIERACRMRKETVEKLEACLETQLSSILLFLTDTDQGISRFLEKYPIFASRFDVRVDIEDYSGEDLVKHAIQYAYDNEYSIDAMGLLALRTRVEEMLEQDDTPEMRDVESIINEAIAHVSKKNVKHFFDILFRRRYDDKDMVILKEKDFS